MPKWYVVQVSPGKEKSIQAQFLRILSRDELPEALVPTYSSKFKLHGEWIEKRNILFPGYVFLVTENIESVMSQCRHVVGMVSVLKNADEVLPITDGERETIRRLTNADANADLSYGFIEGTRVVVTDGPLQGMESQIVKIDRHKRLARISLQMFGRDKEVSIGLEIIRKV